MKAGQLTRGFARLAIVTASLFVFLAAGSGAIGLSIIARTYLMPPDVKVLVPSGHMIKVPFGLTEDQYATILKPYFTDSPPELQKDVEVNPFAKELQKVGAIRLESAVRDAQWPAQRAAEERSDAQRHLLNALLFAVAGFAAYVSIRISGWVLSGFYID